MANIRLLFIAVHAKRRFHYSVCRVIVVYQQHHTPIFHPRPLPSFATAEMAFWLFRLVALNRRTIHKSHSLIILNLNLQFQALFSRFYRR